MQAEARCIGHIRDKSNTQEETKNSLVYQKRETNLILVIFS